MHKFLFHLSTALMLAVVTLPGLAQNEISDINKNPFSQPDILSIRPQPRETMTEIPVQPEISDFILSATLISVNTPMAVVNGELLILGEETAGMRLLSVDEGRAVIKVQGKTFALSIEEKETGQTGKILLRY